MLQRIKAAFTALLLAGTLFMPIAVAVPAYADVAGSKSAACDAIGLGTGDCSGGADTKVTSLFNTIVNLLSIVVGLVAVVMIVISGFRYVTSGGDSNKVSSAKSTLIYAIVGLLIVALAQFIVHFVLQQV